MRKALQAGFNAVSHGTTKTISPISNLTANALDAIATLRLATLNQKEL